MVEGNLGTAKDFFYASFTAKLVAEILRIALIGQGKLVAQVAEAIVDRRCGKHQYFCFYTVYDDFVHQLLVSRFFVFECLVVPEVM